MKGGDEEESTKEQRRVRGKEGRLEEGGVKEGAGS